MVTRIVKGAITGYYGRAGREARADMALAGRRRTEAVVRGEIDLLREIYLHLKKTGFRAGRAGGPEEVEALFKRLAGLLKEAPDMKAAPLILHVDGASRGNPGPAGAGGVILAEDGVTLDSFATYLGVRTNNEAEYMALCEGLKMATELHPSRLTVRSDSLLLVKQMRGEFRIKKRELVLLHLEARKHLPRCPVVFEHVPREENREADRLSNLGVDKGTAGGAAPP